MEEVQVTLTLTHSARGDLSISLICPSGTESLLGATRAKDRCVCVLSLTGACSAWQVRVCSAWQVLAWLTDACLLLRLQLHVNPRKDTCTLVLHLHLHDTYMTCTYTHTVAEARRDSTPGRSPRCGAGARSHWESSSSSSQTHVSQMFPSTFPYTCTCLLETACFTFVLVVASVLSSL